MKIRFQAVLFVLSMLFTSNLAFADQGSGTIIETNLRPKFWDVPLSDSCHGRIDYPHESRHVKNTVNATLSLDCKGEQLGITGLLTRIPIRSLNDMDLQFKTGQNKLALNVNLLCVSPKPKKPIHYIVIGTFSATHHLMVTKRYSIDLIC